MTSVTLHAKQRIKERMGLSSDRIADLARERGIQHCDLKGSIKRYVDGIFLNGKGFSDMRIYNNQVFIFMGNPLTPKLITVFPIPTRYQKEIKKIKEKA